MGEIAWNFAQRVNLDITLLCECIASCLVCVRKRLIVCILGYEWIAVVSVASFQYMTIGVVYPVYVYVLNWMWCHTLPEVKLQYHILYSVNVSEWFCVFVCAHYIHLCKKLCRKWVIPCPPHLPFFPPFHFSATGCFCCRGFLLLLKPLWVCIRTSMYVCTCTHHIYYMFGHYVVMSLPTGHLKPTSVLKKNMCRFGPIRWLVWSDGGFKPTQAVFSSNGA